VAAGSPGLTLTVDGSGFVASSVVRWNGVTRSTTLVSATRLRATITAADLVAARSVPVSVVTPAPGGGISGNVTFTITAAPAPPAPAGPPAMPTDLSVRQVAADVDGVTFAITWRPASGAASYRYLAAFNDGSAAQQGTITGLLSFQLRMPYHASGDSFLGFVCLRSVSSTGLQSSDHACGLVPVPGR
jgi:hypothetical protein